MTGLPPFLPFARAAAALRSDVTLPPFRPRRLAASLTLAATAAEFARVGIDVLLVLPVALFRIGAVATAIGPVVQAIRAALPRCQGVPTQNLGSDVLNGCQCVHAERIPNRLGFCQVGWKGRKWA